MAEQRPTRRGSGRPVPPEATWGQGEETLELLEERPEVSTHRIEAGRVKVGTRVVTEARQLDVIVFHESVVIERRPATEPRVAAGTIGSSPPLHVTVEREEPALELRTFVRERVRVGKRRQEEQRTVSVDARREELDVKRHTLDDRREMGVAEEQPGAEPGRHA